MTRFSLILPMALLWGAVSFAPQKPADSGSLDAVLKTMDTAAANFRATQADFEWDRYEKVIDEVIDVQKGTIYYRRAGKEIEMMADIRMAGSSADELKHEPKYVLFSGGKIRMYQPIPDQLTIYDLGKNAADFESYLVLGFGGSGQELVKSFDVTYLGAQTINGVSTGELQLIPKSEKVRNTFNRILLWIDLQRGISVQQQLVTLQDDYRLATYSDIKLNEPIKGEVFQLKTNKKTQITTPQG